MADSQPALEPEVEIACDACGETESEEVASSAELASQIELARRFHNERLTRRSRAALEERASFTHDYATRLLACCSCNLIYRSPRPAADSVSNAYEYERYAAERLPQMIASQRSLFRPKARSLARVLPPGARVLEMGSFVGGFLREARESGLRAVGLDPNEQMAELGRRAGLPGDTLGPVADESYARCARLEERLVKAAQRRKWARDLSLAPWLDVRLRLDRSRSHGERKASLSKGQTLRA